MKYPVWKSQREHFSGKSLGLNDIVKVQIRLDQKIPFEPYDECPSLGAFVLVDRYSHATVAAGMIRYELRRASNIHLQNMSVDRPSREKLAGHKGSVIWLTGLSGAGKSTILDALCFGLFGKPFRNINKPQLLNSVNGGNCEVEVDFKIGSKK